MLSKEEIVRAWKDKAYRLSLTPEQRAKLPKHPAGLIELTDKDLEQAAGAGMARTLRLCQI